MRDEEGFGLRPNIGIRGLNPARSTKVLLLEDGIPLTYAPYGDNTTYYHPPIDRFERLEVLKGGAQIAYGAQTVGGAINYLTPRPPAQPTGSPTVAGGNRDYINGHTAPRSAAPVPDRLQPVPQRLLLRRPLRPLGDACRRRERQPGRDHQRVLELLHAPLVAAVEQLGTRPNDAADPACAGMANLNTTCGNEGGLREYYNWGVEPRVSIYHRAFGIASETDFGVRAHFENQDRLQANGGKNTAYAGFVQNRFLLAAGLMLLPCLDGGVREAQRPVMLTHAKGTSGSAVVGGRRGSPRLR